ncbi:TetR/AcrR family transcriptional regulator [Raineya orbicola]|uniref:Bacterial regulatory protein, tetR family n=1 Tax=Raineya orbicola TaxID=2016530 RepID=A0A2N3IIA7_9BACT|nr:TetR/AcrR family transcriptional regulator [Raineya orbicola]PKQ70026.1 Bacterial regulatory protein, tetR family [Raineya orbicola]
MEHKERILAKAEELFMRYGIRSITMDDIARELAISKKTIYQYFQDKDALVEQVADRHFRQDETQICKISEHTENAIDEVILMSQHVKNRLKGVNPSVFFDLQRYHPKTWALWQEHKRNFIIAQVRRNLEQGVSEGLYRPDLHIEALAILRVAEIEMSFDIQLFPPDKFDLVSLQMTFLEHFIRGIVTSKGLEVLEKTLQKYEKVFNFSNISIFNPL